MTDSSDKQTMMCGSKLVKNACAHRRVSMRTTGHRNSKTHAHTGTVRICVVMTTHGRDVHALPSLGPNVRRRRTGCVNRYRLQRCGPGSIGKIRWDREQRTHDRLDEAKARCGTSGAERWG